MERARSILSAERGLLLLVIVVRIATLVQVLVGAAFGYDDANPRWLYLAAVACVTAVSLAILHVVWNRQSVQLHRLGYLDIATSTAALVILSQILDSQWLVGSWVAWAAGYGSCVTATVGIWCRRLPLALALSSVVAVAYAASLLDAGIRDMATIFINTAMYLIFTVSTFVLAQYWRTLATHTDDMQDQMLRTMRNAELDRYRLLVHDPATILRMLGDENTPDELLPALREQARAEASRMRAYIDGRAADIVEGDPCRSLEGITRSALDGFPDLPLEVSTMLARNTMLPEAEALTVQRALTTILHNVRLHAAARHVIVHADEFDGKWELTVTDDGVGFDSSTTPLGYGLGEQVVETMSRIGVHVDISSAPGEGTRITLTGTPTDPCCDVPAHTQEPTR